MIRKVPHMLVLKCDAVVYGAYVGVEQVSCGVEVNTFRLTRSRCLDAPSHAIVR